MKMRKKIVAALLAGIALTMAGCGNAIPDMTDDQLQAVGEYTAMLLLSHDVNYRSRLVDVETLIPEEVDEPGIQEVPQETPAPVETPAPENVGMDPTADTPVVDLTGGQGHEEQSEVSLEEALGLSGQMSLSYTGHEIVDSYPQDASSEEYFTVDAEDGNQLLVLHFTLQNLGEGTETADTRGQSLVVRVSVNGISSMSLTTLLENDLMLYQEELNPGESREVVILTEFDSQSLWDVASVEINVKNGDKNATIQLK